MSSGKLSLPLRRKTALPHNMYFYSHSIVPVDVYSPCEYFNCIKHYNTREISPLLKQDVLVLAGTEDLYTIYYEEQLRALTNARSVTGRLFTEEEQASHHCQIGNLQLVLKTIVNWIEKVSDGKKTSTGRR